MVIAPINNPANAAANPAHFNQPSTVPTNTAPGAESSAGGFGMVAAHTTEPGATIAAVSDPARTPTALRYQGRYVGVALIIGNLLDWCKRAQRHTQALTHQRTAQPQTGENLSQNPPSGPLENMKTTLAAATSLLVGVTLLPVLLAGGDPPPPTLCAQTGGSTAVILATIRVTESGGNYQARSAGSTASGAYQFLDTTWNGYGGYTHASDALPAVQDAKATERVNSILDDHDGDVTAIPVVWYVGHLPAPTSTEWDTIPAPNAGNRLTPRQYQAKWMSVYQRELAAEPPATSTASTPAETPTTAVSPTSCLGGGLVPLADDWSLPGPTALIDIDPGVLDDPHHDYPAWDWIIPVGTPIYAIRGGHVAAIHTWAHNWWNEGCGTAGGGDCDTCGVGVTIIDDQSTRWTFCHGSSLTTQLGANIKPGQQIMWSGNTGRSGTPHLHLEITTNGTRRCPQQLLQSLYYNEVGIDPRTLPTVSCSY